jgi:hypothetical protein
MDTRIHELQQQIASLEDELRIAIREREAKVRFTIRGKRVEFEREVRELHLRLKRSVYQWLVTDRPQNLLTGPVIYAMAIPLVVLDLFVSFYQATCFPIYGIGKVRRADYIAFDRHQLGYLNAVERFHCDYCGYANGLLAYASEISARTEQYFCPIKHAHKVLGPHEHYIRFLEYGDSTDFHARLEAFRAGSAPTRNDAHKPDTGPA